MAYGYFKYVNHATQHITCTTNSLKVASVTDKVGAGKSRGDHKDVWYHHWLLRNVIFAMRRMQCSRALTFQVAKNSKAMEFRRHLCIGSITAFLLARRVTFGKIYLLNDLMQYRDACRYTCLSDKGHCFLFTCSTLSQCGFWFCILLGFFFRGKRLLHTNSLRVD